MSTQLASPVRRVPPVEFHNLCRPEELSERMEVFKRIETRARELSRVRGCEEGYEQEDWVQAQSEFLRPVPIEMENFAERIRIRATVSGFEEDELNVSIEPARIIIAGKKERQPEEGNQLFYVDWYPEENLQVVNLPEDIDPALARMVLRDGVLEFDLPKAREWPQWAMGEMDG
ncbi:MAG: Hsp20/alpha crystallin family protein [Terriglobales bacterium]